MLIHSTGDRQVDEVLSGIVGEFEGLFPGRIRGFYLLGSYAAGRPTPTSDIDLIILFREQFADAEKDAAAELSQSLEATSTLQLDIEAVPEEELNPIHAVGILQGGVIVYGEDFTEALPTQEDYAWALVEDVCSLIRRLRWRDDLVSYPVQLPHPQSEFFGYEIKSIKTRDGSTVPSSKALSMITGWAASAVVAIQGRQYLPTKEACLRLYRECVGDSWTDLIEEVHEQCRERWHYLIPKDPDEREELRELCQRVLAFENHALAVFRGFIHTLLAGKDIRDQHRAAALLSQAVVFPDDDTEATLSLIEHSSDTKVRQAVRQALAAIAAARSAD